MMIKIKRINLIILVFYFGGNSCTERPVDPPNEVSYSEQTALMLNICGKFTDETDAKALHKAVVATQSARVVSCADYYGECNLYGDFLNLAIELSKDDVLTQDDRMLLKKKLIELKNSIKSGKEKIHSR